MLWSSLCKKIIILIFCIEPLMAKHILMITIAGTKSHKIPFWELAKGLIERGHHVTFVSGFKTDFHLNGLREITPIRLVQYIENYTDWDLVGARINRKAPISIWQALRYPAEACNSLLEIDPNTSLTIYDELLMEKFHLAILDGAYPECALGIVHELSLPFMYINTVGFYTGSLSVAGNPIVYATTPHVFTALTQTMNVWQRIENIATHIASDILHWYYTNQVHNVLKQNINSNLPHPYAMSKNVSFILHNGHATVTNPRPFYPNVAEIACIHCRPAMQLPDDLEEFMESAPAGVIFFSMGSSVRPANMPEEFRKLLVKVFARLPQYHILWKWDDGSTSGQSSISSDSSSSSSSTGNGHADANVVGGNVTYVIASTTSNATDAVSSAASSLPSVANLTRTTTTTAATTTKTQMLDISSNVRLSAWLPQQDVLGQRKLKAFITHGGLLSMYEAIYHAVPMLMLPVFCDHDVNAAKAAEDGYAVRLPLEDINVDKLHRAILEIIHNGKYKRKILEKRSMLLDQMSTPLETAIFWTEYVIRHKGSADLQAQERHMSFFIYHSLDMAMLFLLISLGIFRIFSLIFHNCQMKSKRKNSLKVVKKMKKK